MIPAVLGVALALGGPAIQHRTVLLELHGAQAEVCTPAVRVHLVTVDTARARVRLVQTKPGADGSLRSALNRAREEGALAAINGGFFHPGYEPIGWRIAEGKTWSVANRKKRGGVAWADARGGWRIERETAFRPGGAKEAIGAWPLLVEAGRAHPNRSTKRAARSAIGILPDGRVVLAATESLPFCGPTLAEWAGFLARSAGCASALNLDGGSSTAFFVRGEADAPDPASFGGRPVPDALGVFATGN